MEINRQPEKNISPSQEITEIRLIGEPYQREVNGTRIDATDVLERLAKNENYQERLKGAIKRNEESLSPLYEAGYYGIDCRIKKGEQLTFEEAFSLMSFVSMASNKQIRLELAKRIDVGDTSKETVTLQGVALLSAMSTKEAYVGLAPEEIAGLVAATLELDTIVRIDGGDQAFGIGGMGGDRGYPKNGNNSKLFSLSTMGSAILANFQNVHKHHSYPNTSKVAGQTAIEAIGGRSDQDSIEELEFLQNESGLLMSSCHTLRTIHTISHRLKGETINHVIGPLAIPVSKDTEINAMIGVNDNVHPETIIKALEILQTKGIQRYASSVAFCGLLTKESQIKDFEESNYYHSKESKKRVALDEVAPPPFDTLAAFMVGGVNRGSFIIKSSDFLDEQFLRQVNFEQLLIPNTAESILRANMDSITGEDLAKSIYLSMTVALGVFIKDYAHLPEALNEKTRRVNPKMLREAFIR
jgi:anthranilate phosphoribosyltransferase